jgi:hypothetical protein
VTVGRHVGDGDMDGGDGSRGASRHIGCLGSGRRTGGCFRAGFKPWFWSEEFEVGGVSGDGVMGGEWDFLLEGADWGRSECS